MTFSPWLATMLHMARQGIYIKIIRNCKALELLISLYMRTNTVRLKMKEFTGFVEERIDRRLGQDKSRPDVWGLVTTHDNDGSRLSRDEMCKNAIVFMLGGTETTSSLLAGLTFLLLQHPDKLAKLTAETRDRFLHDADIRMDNLMSLEYLNACIEEALRIFPPTPVGLPRVTPAGGATIIDGHVVPGSVRSSPARMNCSYRTHC